MSNEKVDTATTLALLERSINDNNKMFERMDTTLSGITEMCGQLKTIVSLHEQSINNIEKNDEVKSKIVDTQISDLSKEVRESHGVMLTEMQKTRDYIDSRIKEVGSASSDDDDEIKARLTQVEVFKWKAIGIASVVPIVISLAPYILKAL